MDHVKGRESMEDRNILQEPLPQKKQAKKEYGAFMEKIPLLLGEYYDNLKSFYDDIMTKHSEYDYITFVVRRSLLLAEVFYKIFWEEGDEARKRVLKEARRKFRTDSSILMACRQAEMPSILLVDELMLHGDSMNQIFQEIHQVYQETQGNNYDKMDFLSHMNIAVFCRDENTSIVTSCLFSNFHVAQWMDDRQWHDFSNRVGILMQDFPLINTAFTLGVHVPDHIDIPPEVDGFSMIETESMDLKEQVYFFDSLDFATVRRIYHKASQSYTLIPFLFLPDIPEPLFQGFSQKILHHLLPDEAVDRVLVDSRCAYELLSLFLSTTVLEIFCNNCHHSDLKDLTQLEMNSFGIRTNFAMDLEETQEKALFHKLRTPLSYWSEQTFVTAIEDLTRQIKPIESMTNGLDLAPMGIYYENLIYQKKIEELEQKQKKRKGLSHKKTRRSESLQSYLLQWKDTRKETFGWLLQLMDRGIISLKMEKNNHCLQQTLRTGEASLFIGPKRYEHFIPMFTLYVSHLHRDDMESVISGLVTKMEELGQSPRKTLREELMNFLSLIKRSQQDFTTWDIPLYSGGFPYE